MTHAEQLGKDYSNHTLVGWAEYIKPGLVAQYLNLCSPQLLRTPPIFNNYDKYKGGKYMLYLAVRKVLGDDTDNEAQLIGDCVSWGAKNGSEYTTCCDILMRGDREKYKKIFPPYYYGTGRVYVGGWDNDYSDGSLGSYMAEAVMKYGTLFRDEPGVPTYNADVAKEWGAKRSVLDKWKPIAIKYLVQDAVMIKSWEELVCAIANGYACPTASNVGYDMEASNDGFHRQTTNWAHQMTWIGLSDNSSDPYAILLNSWGDAHGRLKDFDDGHMLPAGVLRVRRKDVEKHIREQETYAYANVIGFPEQKINEALLKLG